LAVAAFASLLIGLSIAQIFKGALASL
jgi:hypothetical protein